MSAPDPRPVPQPTPETRPYWEATARHELVRHRCAACGSGSQHPRAVCAGCGGTDLEWVPCSGRATLHSFVIVHRPEPVFADDAPFVLAVVDVEPVPQALPLDLPLELRWLPRGEVNLPVFAPAGAP